MSLHVTLRRARPAITILLLSHALAACDSPTMPAGGRPATAVLTAGPGGLTAVFYDHPNFTGGRAVRIDPEVSYPAGAPLPAGITGSHAVRWAGRLTAIETGAHTFVVTVSGGVRLWIDDILIVDERADHAGVHATPPLALVAGRPVHFVLEYTSTAAPASSSIGVQWVRPGAASATSIPQPQLSPDRRVYPADANFIDVTRPPFGAVGDGIADDTAAINAAIQAARFTTGERGTGNTVYFPAGVYRVTDTITYVTGQRISLRGEHRDHAIIKLADHAPRFGDPGAPRPLFTQYSVPGGQSGNEFGHTVSDLTFDTGADNPGATGFVSHNNNQGAIRDVTIRTSDPGRRGVIGLDFSDPYPGPTLVSNVLIEGFDYAMYNNGQFNYSQTFEHIHIQHQNVQGIYNANGSQFFRDLRSINAVKAVTILTDSSLFVFVDSEFRGGSPASPAIYNVGTLLLRNVTFQGYDRPLEFAFTIPNAVTEFVQGPAYLGNSTPYGFAPTTGRTLGLPVEESPETPHIVPGDAIAVDGSAADDTAAIQAAIDGAAALGRHTVYFPKARYLISGTIYVHGSVRYLCGLGSELVMATSLGQQIQVNPDVFITNAATDRAFELTDDLDGDLVIDQFVTGFTSARDFLWFDDLSSHTVSIRHTIFNDGRAYRYGGTTQGRKLFIDDVTGHSWSFSRGQRVWARQLNPERRIDGPFVVTGPSINILNDGATLWALGIKTEGNQTLLATTGGGRSELLGVWSLADGDPPTVPMFTNTDSMLTVSAVGTWTDTWVREVRAGVTRDLTSGALVGPAAIRKLSLYTSVPP